MTTESETRTARYAEIQREPDRLGRVIGVRRLRPSEQTKLVGMTPELNGYEEIPDPETGDLRKVPARVPLQVAAAVCQIDGVPIPFPRGRGELDAIYDRLDVEGIEAALKGLAKLNPVKKPSELDGMDDQPSSKDEAKNSSGTSPSA